MARAKTVRPVPLGAAGADAVRLRERIDALQRRKRPTGSARTGSIDSPERAGGGNRPALADPVVLGLPGGGSVAVRAADVKRDPAHTLTSAAGPG